MAELQQEKERKGWEYTKENWSGWVKKEKEKKRREWVGSYQENEMKRGWGGGGGMKKQKTKKKEK